MKEDLFHLRDYVQNIGETNTSHAAATALIESAFNGRNDIHLL